MARHSRFCTGFFRCPDYDSDALADFLIRLAEAKGLKDWLLLPSNDHAVLTLSRNKATGCKAFLAHDKAQLHHQLARIAATFPVQKTLTQSKKLLKALNYTGVCEVEYLKDPGDGQYKLIEINARTWLWVGLARACGIDFAKMVYDYVNGKERAYPDGYEIDIGWLNPWTDTAYSAKAILQGHLSIRAYLGSLMNGKTVSALFEKGDARPGMAYLLNMMSYLKKR